MDRRVVAILASTVLLGGVVAAVLIARGGDDSESASSTDLATKPVVEVPEGPPPDELVSEDLGEGNGATAETGDQVTVQYVGVDFETGEEFDSSWERPEPFRFQLGGGQVIEGWDEVAGMREGGRRQLVIPPDLAYGRRGSPPAIGANATLVFVIDLVSVE